MEGKAEDSEGNRYAGVMSSTGTQTKTSHPLHHSPRQVGPERLDRDACGTCGSHLSWDTCPRPELI